MYQIEVTLGFLSILREDEDVIDTHPYENPQVVSENFIGHTLECPWCIAEPERHNNPFKGPKLRVEGSFFDIFVMYSNRVDPTDKMNLGKSGRTPQCTRYGLDRR